MHAVVLWEAAGTQASKTKERQHLCKQTCPPPRRSRIPWYACASPRATGQVCSPASHIPHGVHSTSGAARHDGMRSARRSHGLVSRAWARHGHHGQTIREHASGHGSVSQRGRFRRALGGVHAPGDCGGHSLGPPRRLRCRGQVVAPPTPGVGTGICERSGEAQPRPSSCRRGGGRTGCQADGGAIAGRWTRRTGKASRAPVPAQGMAQQGPAGDGKQPPLMLRSGCLPRLRPSVRRQRRVGTPRQGESRTRRASPWPRDPRRPAFKTQGIQDTGHSRHRAFKTIHTQTTRGPGDRRRRIVSPVHPPWGQGEATRAAVPGRAPNQRLHLTPGSGVPWLGTVSVAPAQVKRGVRQLKQDRGNPRHAFAAAQSCRRMT